MNEKISTDVIMNIRFVTVDGEFVAGGDYFLPEGIQNMSILEQYVPEGYKMMESGDFTVTADGQEDITVEKISEDVIMNIRFVLADGTFVLKRRLLPARGHPEHEHSGASTCPRGTR